MAVSLRGKRVLVFGLGVHGGGVGVTRWLVGQGARVTVTDLKRRAELASSLAQLRGLRITYVLGRHRLSDIVASDLIIQNPGVPATSPYLAAARKRGIPIETDIGLFFTICPAPIIGVTGTKGKSTTTTLIGECFRAARRPPLVAGNIRRSPFDGLRSLTAKTPVVLELSSWQLEGLVAHTISPAVAVMTNVSADHLDRYPSFGAYVAAKELIWKFQTTSDVCILNRDNPLTRRMGARVPGRRLWFSRRPFAGENGCCVRAGWIVYRAAGREERVLPVRQLQVYGEHNLENVLAAVAAARVSGVPLAAVRRAVKNFRGIPDRLERIRTLDGVTYYNDTTATAPAAAMQALATLGRHPRGKHIVLIAGGADKALPFTEFARQVRRYCATVILLPGSATPKLAAALRRAGVTVSVPVGSMKQAVVQAQAAARAGESVLLSPGCASFGLFQNEFDRGEQFRSAVRALTKRRT